jgi:hypothetical protein
MREKTERHLVVAIWSLPIILGVALMALTMIPATLRATPYDSQLGTRWQVNEQGWRGVWIRRGASNIFDARWNTPGQAEIQGVVEIRLDGRNIRMSRTDMFTGQRCEYRGEVSRDWRSARGWLSCNGGPRVNWNADIYQERSERNAEVIIPQPNYPPRSEGQIIPRYNEGYGSVRFDLTGVWQGSDGGTYYIRQLGNHVWWYGESPNGQWSNIFHGALDGEWLEGLWLDVPKGRDHDHGALRLRVDSSGEFHREQKSGDDFGGSRWRRVR